MPDKYQNKQQIISCWPFLYAFATCDQSYKYPLIFRHIKTKSSNCFFSNKTSYLGIEILSPKTNTSMSRELHSPSEEIIAQTDIASLAQQFVLNLFNQKNDARLVFRTYRQTMEIVKMVNSLAQANGSTQQEWETAALAAWFSNAGYLFDYQNPEPKSVELAEKFFNAHHFPTEKKAPIIATLRDYFNDKSLRTTEGQLMSDAVNAVHYSSAFFEYSPLMRLEQELLVNRHFTKEEWEAYQMQLLLNVRFFTSPAKLNYEPIVQPYPVAEGTPRQAQGQGTATKPAGRQEVSGPEK
jgi:hypothetical protein